MVSRLALVGIAVIFAAGAWLIAAPFVLRYQAVGAPWTDAARLDVFVGSVLAAAGSAASSPRWPAGSVNCMRRPAPLRSRAAGRGRVCNS